MKLAARMALPLGLLLAFVVGEFFFRRHLSRFDEGAYPDLLAPFAELPMELKSEMGAASFAANWEGVQHGDIDEVRKHLPYQADDLTLRLYKEANTGVQLQLYMVYSKIGDDRKHHPEICIRDVSGAPEELSFRKTIELDAEGTRRVQRFRFVTGSSTRTTVYYWHYTFPPIAQPERDWLQTIHLQLRHPSPSMTVQIATAAPPIGLDLIEQSFLRAVDGALKSRHLPPSALCGCDRLPIGLVRQ
jgi:hypothetical protein